nr:MAG TPA: hypothetical protein [Caudoviricetes sp.]
MYHKLKLNNKQIDNFIEFRNKNKGVITDFHVTCCKGKYIVFFHCPWKMTVKDFE